MTAKAAILILDADDSRRARWWHPRHGAGSGSLADMPTPGRWPLWVWIDTDQVLVSAANPFSNQLAPAPVGMVPNGGGGGGGG